MTKLDINERLSLHFSAAKKSQYPIQHAIAKYGEENFTIEALCVGPTKEYISALEEPAIQLFESHISQNGYNVAKGGCGGDLGPEANKKRSDTMRNYPLEKKERLSKIQRERQLGKTKENDAGRLSQSIAVTGNQFALGLKHSEETKQLISELHKGKPKSQKTRQRMSESAKINHNSKRFSGRNACCLCCHKEWDIGNYTQHIKRKFNEL